MATTINAGSIFLAAASPRLLTAPNADIILKATSTIFHVNTSGVSDTASTIITATLISLEGTVEWSVVGATLASVSGNTAVLAFTGMAGTKATVTATLTYRGVVFTDDIVISVVSDGSATTTYTWIKYADDAVGTGLSDSPTGKKYLGLGQNKTTATESVNPVDYQWSLITGPDGVAGTNGVDGATTYTWIKYSDAADGIGLYDLPTANTLYIGISPNRTTATEGGVNTDYVWSKFKGDTGVPGTNGTNGANGSRGAGHFYAVGSAWTDAAANTATPGENVLDDVVTISDGTAFVSEKKWTGTAWAPTGVVIDGSLLVNGSVTAAKVNTNGLSIKKADGTVILDAGGTGLQAGFEAPGTLNSALVPSINSAATTANWSLVANNDGNRPANGATVGANRTNLNVTLGGDNLANNSSFEQMNSGVASGWSIYNNGGAGEPTSGYQAAGRVGGIAQGVAWENSHTQTKGIQGVACRGGWQPNKTYIVSFYATTTNVAGNPGFFLAWNTAPATTVTLSNPGLLTTYQRYSFMITWGAAVEANGWVFVSVAYGSGGGNVIFDDIMVIEGDVLPSYYPSSAEAQSTALAAQVAANTANNALVNKLNKNSNDILGGILSIDTVAAAAGFRAGNLTWNAAGDRTGGYGVAMTPKGLVGYNAAGVATFSINASTGKAIFADELQAAYGTFGSVSVAAGGKVSVGAASYGATGIWMGYDGGVPKFSAGDALQYFKWNGSTVEIKLNKVVLAALTDVSSPSGANGTRIYTTRTASITSGGTAPFTYEWYYSYAEGLSLYDAGTATCTVVGTATNDGTSGRLVCNVTDSSGLSASVSCNVSGVHGSPP